MYFYFQWFFEALFPPKCLICKKEGAFLCQKHKTFIPAPKNEVSFQYLNRILAGTQYYSTPSKQVIEFFKFRGFKALAEIMGEVIERACFNDPEFFEGAVLVPIPLHWTRKFWRGFNQSYVLALELQKKHPSVSISTDLKRKKRTAQQAKMSKKERANNLKNAFYWSGKSIPSKIILVDDVVASGKTLDEVAKVLKEKGCQNVMAVVFARGGKN